MKKSIDLKSLINIGGDVCAAPTILYYDETNNARRLYIRNNQLNISSNESFVLGGISSPNGVIIDNDEYTQLRERLGIQDSSPEIKFNLIAKGDFRNILRSRKVSLLLSWLLEKNYILHYSSVNFVYWISVDFIDSILKYEQRPHILRSSDNLKETFYSVVNDNLAEFLKIISKYGYPDIHKKSIYDLYADLAKLSKTSKVTVPEFGSPLSMLSHVFENGSAITKSLVMQNKDIGVSIDKFVDFYINSMKRAPYSTHIFDEEAVVQKDLCGTTFHVDGAITPPIFIDSKKSPEVQISDCIVGIFGKLLRFIDNNSATYLKNIRTEMTEMEIDNINKIAQLILISHRFSSAMFHRANCIGNRIKEEIFIFGEHEAKLI